MKKVLQCGNQSIELEVVRSKRRTLAISVDSSASVTVRAPLKLSLQRIMTIVEEKNDWIASKLLFWQKVQKQRRAEQDVYGKRLLYLGKYYKLQVMTLPGLKKDNVQLDEGQISVFVESNEPERIRKVLTKWYKERAQQHIEQRVAYYGSLFKERPLAVKVKEQKKRWGSCTFDNKLLFNWRCMMATEEALDYVVVHELCHMPHKNHSRDFWQAVERILPDFRQQKKWLKENGINLDL